MIVADHSPQKWRPAFIRPFQIRIIDNLFALLRLFVPLGPSLLLPIGASVFIQALVIVNVLAQSALTISLSDPVTRDIKAPTFALSSPVDEAISREFVISADTPSVMSVIPKWELILQSTLLYPPKTFHKGVE